jgi:hypothetical protein
MRVQSPLPVFPRAPVDRCQPTCTGRTIPSNPAMRTVTCVQFGTSTQEGAHSPAGANHLPPLLICINRVRASGCYTLRMHPDDHLPGQPAASTGRYVELNVFGTPTGNVTHAAEGQPLPVSPRGFTWRRIGSEEC